MRFDSSSGSGETFRRDSGPEGTEAKRTGKGTFAGCKNLEEVFANKTVIIDGKAFEHCRK